MVAEFTVPGVLTRVRDADPGRIALIDASDSTSYTYGDLVETADLWSQALTERIPRGRRIGVMVDSGAELSRWVLAVMWRHAVVPLSPTLSDDELARYLTLTGAKWIIASDRADSIAHVCALHGVEVLAPREIERHAPTQTQTVLCADGDDVAAVLLTSGSTSVPKVVPLRHKNLVTSAHHVANSVELSAEDRCLVLWAQYHIGGLVDLLLAPLSSGGTVINAGQFSLDKIKTLVHSTQPTWIQFVPTTLDETVRDCERGSTTLRPNALRFIRCVAAPMMPQLWERAEAAFGCPLVHTYGMTEASPLVTSTPLDSAQRVTGSAGRSQGTAIRIVDDNDRDVPAGVQGSILLKGDNVFSGYEGDANPEKTFVDGWFRTGDLGHVDAHGELFVVGREKQMINRGGEKINPAEIEDVLRSHPDVIDAAVFGIPHKRLGSIVSAAVSTTAKLDADDLTAYVRARLSAHKVPSRIQILASLPKNDVGKVDRLSLAANARTRDTSRADRFRSDIEREIASIWAVELDEPDLSPTVAFTVAGGDSLSAVRVVAEVEQKFGVTGSSRRLLEAGTIRLMASIVEAAIQSAPGVASPTSRASVTLRPAELVRWDNALDVGDFVDRIARAPSTVVRDYELQLALTHLCADEIDSLIVELAEVDEMALSPGSPIVSLRPRHRPRRGARRPWSRTRVHEYVSLYERTDVDERGTTLIAFTGNMLRLMLPIHCILTNLPASVTSVVLVADIERKFYVTGVKGLCEDAGQMAGALRSVLPSESLTSVSTMGTSAGGLAALITGMDLEARRVALVGPDSPVRHPALESLLFERSARAAVSVETRIVRGLTQRDLEGARDIATIVPDVVTRRFPVPQHNTLVPAWRMGRLHALLEWLVDIGED